MPTASSTSPQKNVAAWKFVIPSLLGIFLFMLPLPYDGSYTIPVAILAKALVAVLGDSALWVLVGLISVSAVMSTYTLLAKPAFLGKNALLTSLFQVSKAWYTVRMLGWLLVLVCAFKIGPEALWSGDTGGLILGDLLPTLLSVFIFAGLLLPLLLNFGLLEFIGTLLTKVMRPVFGLPGRSAVDSMASWLGDGSVGILLTNKQYEDKHYTQREGVVIATTFSAVSITFSLVVLAQVNLEHMFAPFYLTVCVAGLAAAVIVPRLPPLSGFKDQFIDGSKRQQDDEMIPSGYNSFTWGWQQALTQAGRASHPKQLVKQGMHNVLDMVLGVLPVIMAVGTVALVVAEYTPIFSYLGKPFIPLLELLQLPEAARASETLVVGFADMFIPSILAASIEADITRFVIAAVSVTQLIYLSEVGALIMGSQLPVKLWQLFAIFLIRTLVTLPIISLMAHLFF
ncbi:YjiH family protein [Agarivorans sp. 1_MG-2023]|uniref:YjiH family protein n=1 Tax=Agarivorans sp. 1_MG-2023 TaxID=3062634 RepID=UPI0026E1FCBB|nr:YjiH family protein [Agarivorans sp. 1_MG-2023]MDO6763799.1 YjiH family protein [Agarivorans sp. 1_MG-2023]